MQWITVCGPALYLALLAVGALYLHPHPLPPFWPAFALAVAVSALGTFVFSRFVFAHVHRQEEEIVRRTRELAEVKEAMAVVKERQRIARELHDSLAQSLGYLHLRLADAERQIAGDGTGQLRAELADLKQVARAAYDEARQAIFGLRSMVSRSLGLVPTLTEYLHDWSRQTGVAVDLKAEEAMTLPPVVEVQLIGIIQEAMANVRKHADARHVLVSVAREGGVTRVSIHDDGRGFDPAALAREESPGSFGIETMRERAETVGGALIVNSRPGEGTGVTVELPVSGPARREL
ncbi:MAG: sensor histidine kinase [Candidatus Rokubacteria bacterium]|nr:sensor histidine kinase [Candidatus Rokubacteria bacterium]